LGRRPACGLISACAAIPRFSKSSRAAPQKGAAAGAGCWRWPCSRRGVVLVASRASNQSRPCAGKGRGKPRLRPFVVAPNRRLVFRVRCATCLKRRWPWRAGRFRRVQLTPRSARKRGRQFPFFRRFKTCPDRHLLDTNTRARLMLDAPLLTTYTVTTNDLARLQPLGKTWLAKSQQTALDYETELELVAEKSHSHPELIRRLNPGRELDQPRGRHGFENSRRGIIRSRRTRRRSRSFICRGNFWRRLTRRRTCSRIFRAASRRTSRNGRSANCTWSSSRRTRITRWIRSFFPNRRVAGHRPQIDFAARPEQSGRRGVDWPGQDRLRHSRHARAGAGGADGIARLLPAGELGRGVFVAWCGWGCRCWSSRE
jgi:hypothetical protein